MKNFNSHSIVVALVVCFALGLIGVANVLAATTPTLGTAATYGVLGSTYTDTSAGTTINGDVGFTTPPATAPAGVHTYYGSGAPYATAGIDQGSALSTLASQACTFTFAPGAINLSTDTTHGPIGAYTPGVYCSSGAMNVGGPLALNGNGTYIFRPDGALTSTAGAVVTLNGVSACDVFWTPTQATTLAANTTFMGTVIDDAGITVGANTTWTGKALAFGGTVTTDTDTITVPTCTLTLAPATLRVIKQMVNNDGGTAIASDFNLHVRFAGSEVSGSPATGVTLPGRSYSLSAGTYVVSEDADASYTQSFSGDCDVNGNVVLISGDNKTCTITNNDIAPVIVLPPLASTINVTKVVINDNGGIKTVADFPLFVNNTLVVSGVANVFLAPATYIVTETADSNYTRTFSGDCDINGNVSLASGDNKVCVVTNNDIAPVVVVTPPALPNTGIAPQEAGISWNIVMLASIIVLVTTSVAVFLRKRTI